MGVVIYGRGKIKIGCFAGPVLLGPNKSAFKQVECTLWGMLL